MSSIENQQKSKKKPLSNYAKYSGIGITMLVIILLGSFTGVKLDKLLSLKFPIFTLVLSLSSVIFAMYYMMKDFLKK